MSLYEHAYEPTPPRPEYDPAMDEPEPIFRPSAALGNRTDGKSTPRRKPPFETVKTERGRTHRFKSFTVFTGYCMGFPDLKYASLFLTELDVAPVIMCDRKDIARSLRLNRKGKPC